MPSTYNSLHYHLIFSTKDREPFIADQWQSRVHQYMGGIVNQLGGQSESVGGVADHVHLLVGLSATHRLADFMRDLKKGSSKWISDVLEQPNFAWQKGYGAFSVSASNRKAVCQYIRNQKEHHRNKSFREELLEFIERAGLEIDETYLD